MESGSRVSGEGKKKKTTLNAPHCHLPVSHGTSDGPGPLQSDSEKAKEFKAPVFQDLAVMSFDALLASL